MSKKQIIILGAGISGLSLGWFLKQRFGDAIDITLIEKEKRVGGWIHSSTHDGFLFEEGPRAFRTKGKGKATLQLIQQLGLESELIPASPQSKRRYLYLNGKLCTLPGISFLWHLCKAIWREKRAYPDAVEEETIDHFFRRRFGHAFTDSAVDALVSGIYAGDSRLLSMKSCFPLIHQMDQQHGSLFRALWHRKKIKPNTDPFIYKMQNHSLLTFKNGMESLTQAIYNQLDAAFLLGEEVVSLRSNGEVVLRERVLQGDVLISALPAHALVRLIPEESELLERIPYVSLKVVNIGYKNLSLPKQGFGYLVPRREGEKILGCVWNSSVFPQHVPERGAGVTVMMRSEYGVEVALESLQRHLGIVAKPDVLDVKEVRRAIPQYLVGHEECVNELRQRVPWLHLLGAAFGGVGVNDCIDSASVCSTGFDL